MNIGINIWDDYGDGEETYIYIDEDWMTDDAQLFCLNQVDMGLNLLNYDNLKREIKYYDSRDKYPALEEEYHFTRWEIRVNGLLYEDIDKLVNDLNELNIWLNNEHKFEFYSES